MIDLGQRQRLQRQSNAFCILGLICVLTSRLIRYSAGGEAPAITVLSLAFFGFGCWVRGVAALSESKGHSKWFGALGLLSFIGWAIVNYGFSDRWVEERSKTAFGGDYPRQNP